MLETILASLAGAFAVAGPVVGWLVKLEGRMTRLEVTITERLPAPSMRQPGAKS